MCQRLPQRQVPWCRQARPSRAGAACPPRQTHRTCTSTPDSSKAGPQPLRNFAEAAKEATSRLVSLHTWSMPGSRSSIDEGPLAAVMLQLGLTSDCENTMIRCLKQL